MPRYKYSTTTSYVDPSTGFISVIGGAQVYVYEADESGEVPIGQTLYASSTGGTTKTNPFTATDDGLVEFFLNSPQEVSIKVTHPSYDDFRINFEQLSGFFGFTPYRIFNVFDFGATGTYGENQTEALIDCRDAIIANITSSGGYGAIMEFPSGSFHTSEPINYTSVFGIHIRGTGPNSSIIRCWPRVDKWDGMQVICFANSSNCGISNMDIRNDVAAVASGQNVPDCLVLYAQGPGGGSNANYAYNNRLEGTTKYAPFINIGVPSCTFEGFHIYQHATDDDNGSTVSNNTPESSCIILHAKNILNIAANDGTAITTGYSLMTDITFTHTELHLNIAADLDIATSDGQAIWQHDTGQVKFIGGRNFSSGSNRYIRYSGEDTTASGTGIFTSTYQGITAYPEEAFYWPGPTPPAYEIARAPMYFIDYDNSGTGVSNSAKKIFNCRIEDCRIILRGSPTVGPEDPDDATILHTEAGVSVDNFYLETWEHNDPVYTGKVVIMENHANNELVNPHIDAHGLDITVGALGDILKARHLRNYGTLTAATITDLFPTDYVSAVGDLLEGSGTKALRRLAIGSGNHALYNIGGALGWGPSLRSIMSAAGDLAVGTGGATFTNLTKGSNGQVLSVVSGALAWASSALLNYLDYLTGSAPANPDSGNRRIYSKTVSSQFQNGHLFQLDSSGGEQEILQGTLVAAAARTTSTQAITTSSWISVTFTDELKDVDNGIALGTSASRINIPSTGTYLVIGTIELASGGGSFRGLRVLQSGSVVVALTQASPIAGGYPSVFQVVGRYSTNATNTYLELQVYHDVGSDLNVQATQTQPKLEVIRLGPYI